MRIPPQIIEALIPAAGPCYPDWNSVRSSIENLYHESEHAEIWNHAARFWVCGIQQQYGKGYEIYETENFLLLSKDDTGSIKRACKAYEEALKEIFKLLPGIASNNNSGKFIGLMFGSEDEYYRYISPYQATGYNPSSGGIFIKTGYPHFAFPAVDYASSKTVFVHELTHACMRHLALPMWIDEAIAIRMELLICNTATLIMDRDLLAAHEAYWNESTIQNFWNGISWHTPDGGSLVSYSLSQILWKRIEQDLKASQEEIRLFLTTADTEDGGEAAFQQIFDHSLGDLAASFLGEGNWSPDPTVWPTLLAEDETEADEESATDDQEYQLDINLYDFEQLPELSIEEARLALPILEQNWIRYYVHDESSLNGTLKSLEDFSLDSISEAICLLVHREDLDRYFTLMNKHLGHPTPVTHKKSTWKNRVRGLDYSPNDTP